MGDRGNICVLQGDGTGVWLYSHWGGHRLRDTVERALANSEGRVGDSQYLTRIVFCHMLADGFRDLNTKEAGVEIYRREVARDELDTGFFVQMAGELFATTGAGIGTSGAGDQEHPTVVVDAMTGDIWEDPKSPTETKQVIENRLETVRAMVGA